MGDRLRVFGIDIIKGSVRSRSERPRYALVRLEGGVITRESEVTGYRLRRLVVSDQPDILAVDSIQEIAVDQHELSAFLQSIPPRVRLVQVTGGERLETLGKVAARYNISFDRFDPFDEARTIARVAHLGAGAEVIAFQNTTELVVSRHRSPGKGGWSQNRYVRKIHGHVKQRAREIETELIGAGLRYQKKETLAFGGLSRVAFTIQAPRDQIPVSPSAGADVQVRITGRRLDRIIFRPRSTRPRYLVVGIDPGTTTAIAALDLDGNLVLLTSSRQMSMGDVTEALYNVGKPLVVATDVQEMPFSVEKIRRSFNAIGHHPRQSLSVEEKVSLCAPYQYLNDHERDALSAALDAYRPLRNKFANIVRRVPPGHDLDEVRARFVRGQPLDQIIGSLSGKEERERTGDVPSPEVQTEQDERVRVLDGMVKKLRTYLTEMQKELSAKDAEITRLKALLKRSRSSRDLRARRDLEIARRDAVIAGLKATVRKAQKSNRSLLKRLGRLKEIEEISLTGESVPVKVLGTLTRDALREMTGDLGVQENDLLYVHRTEEWGRSVIRDLAGARVKGIVCATDTGGRIDPALLNECRELNVPLLDNSAIGALIRGKFGIAPADRVRAALAAWQQGQEEHERDKKTRLVEHILGEYRTERGKEMRKGG